MSNRQPCSKCRKYPTAGQMAALNRQRMAEIRKPVVLKNPLSQRNMPAGENNAGNQNPQNNQSNEKKEVPPHVMARIMEIQDKANSFIHFKPPIGEF